MKIISGIYEIVNIENGKRYIGSTADIRTRWRKHRNRLRRGNHRNSFLQYSWNKYGESKFIFRILEICERDKNILLEREQFYINKINPEYNIAPVAGSNLGIKRSVETRRKMSKNNIGRQRFLGHSHTQEAKDKIAAANRGKIVSEETKRKISDAKKGTVCSLETRKKLSESGRGRIISQETRDKISKALKGRKMTPEAIRNLKKALTGRKMPKISQAHKDAISRAHKGKVVSAETRKKLSEAKKAYYQKLREEKGEY